jgi:hypothetical protein
MGPEENIAGFMIAVASGIVLGVAVLLLIYKMVDGDLPVAPGLCALIMIVLSMALAIRPPHPVVPGVVLVFALTLMAFFPYAEQVLEAYELRAVDAERLARSYAAVDVRPDNFAAKFELARLLHSHGFKAQAVHLSGSTLATLDTQRDEVKNRSMRDVFHREEQLLKRWHGESQNAEALKCPGCGAFNRPNELFCNGCGRPYMLDIVRGQEVKPRVWAKLVLAWAALALLIPGAVAIAMSMEGIVRIVTFTGAIAVVGGLIAWLFRPPKHAPVFDWT